jgi:hypothetical protein
MKNNFYNSISNCKFLFAKTVLFVEVDGGFVIKSSGHVNFADALPFRIFHDLLEELTPHTSPPKSRDDIEVSHVAEYCALGKVICVSPIDESNYLSIQFGHKQFCSRGSS